MTVRFRRSMKIAPGIRINFNTHSTSLSLGPRGAHYTMNSNGRRTVSAGIPVVKKMEWAIKFNEIVRRDTKTKASIEAIDWTYFVSWECRIKENALEEAIEIQKLMKRKSSKRRKEQHL
jgi:G:T-mismatch repair DNA endonuclease (very short patch repair protein)